MKLNIKTLFSFSSNADERKEYCKQIRIYIVILKVTFPNGIDIVYNFK